MSMFSMLPALGAGGLPTPVCAQLQDSAQPTLRRPSSQRLTRLSLTVNWGCSQPQGQAVEVLAAAWVVLVHGAHGLDQRGGTETG